MAFTKTPQNDTYQTKPFPLFQALDKRSNSTAYDADYLNCFFEVQQNKQLKDGTAHITKRAGTTTFGDTLPSANVRGVYYWEDQTKIYVAVDNDIVILHASTGATITTLSNVFSTSSGKVGFTEFYYDDTSVKVVVTDGTTLATIDSANTFAASADGDLPAPHIPTPIFLDGYLFLAEADSADIYNSDLNDPLAWTPGNFLSAEMFPDVIVDIAKLNNYLIALGSASIEYFWDAGNASGSPLQRNDTPVKLTGYIGGFAQTGNSIYFVGNNTTGTPCVFRLEDFKMEEVSDPTVRKFLEVPTNLPIYGAVVSFLGHDFYVLTLSDTSYAMDIKTGLWTRFAHGQETDFPVIFFVRTNTTDSNAILYMVERNTLHKFEPTVYQDAGTNFTMQIVTDKEYFESYRNKWMSRLSVWADRVDGDLAVSWTDNDYQTFTTPVNIPLDQDLPSIHRLGRFRRRALKLAFTENLPLRIEAVEVDYNLGQT